MSFRRFALFDAVGAGLWATAFSLLGYVSWRSLDHALEVARRGKLGLALLLALALGALAAHRLIRDPRCRHDAKTWLRETVGAVALRRRRPRESGMGSEPHGRPDSAPRRFTTKRDP
jgi:hypothetical protein